MVFYPLFCTHPPCWPLRHSLAMWSSYSLVSFLLPLPSKLPGMGQHWTFQICFPGSTSLTRYLGLYSGACVCCGHLHFSKETRDGWMWTFLLYPLSLTFLQAVNIRVSVNLPPCCPNGSSGFLWPGSLLHAFPTQGSHWDAYTLPPTVLGPWAPRPLGSKAALTTLNAAIIPSLPSPFHT